MATYLYARVSTEGKGQTTENQRKMVEDAGFRIDEFFSEDGVSGSVRAANRPVFKRMLEKCQPNDQIIITMIDRLGRSASDILNVVEMLKLRGIKLKVMQFDGMDITSAMGKMILTCMSAMAELERNILIERTNAGLARTKAAGTKLGRPMTVEPAILRMAAEQVKQGLGWAKIAENVGAPKSTLHRTYMAWHDDLDSYAHEWHTRKAQYDRNAG